MKEVDYLQKKGNQNMCQCEDKSCCCKAASKVLAALLIAGGLVLCGFFPGYYYYQSKINSNFVTVKGLAEKDVKANLGIWNIRYTVTNNDLAMAQQEIQSQKEIIYGFLANQKIESAEISEGRVETSDVMANPYRSGTDTGARFIVSQSLTVRSNDVDKIEAALRKNGELVAKGIIMDNQYSSPVAYLFTDINSVKPEMLEDATHNAAAAAAEFAKSSSSKVGRIKRASQGVFSVLPREQRPDAVESQSIDKTIRVVSTIEYWLE